MSTKLGFGSGTPLGTWKADVLFPALGASHSAYLAWENDEERSKKIEQALLDAEQALMPLYVQMLGMAYFNPLASNTDLEAMGFPKREEDTRQPAPVADEAPEIAYEVMPRRVRVYYFKPGSKRKSGKPRGQHGAELLWEVFDASTSGILLKDLTKSSFDTASPYTFEFSDAESGKRLFFALRWENSRGEKGPWSDIHSVVIP
jgi:hypothetical protein